MTFPTGIQQVVVEAGTYTSQGGSNAYSGTITFTPRAARYHIASGTPLPDDPIVLDLSAGQGSVNLVASDATGCDVTDVQYDVAFAITGPAGRRLSISNRIVYLQRAVPIVDLDALTPVIGATPVGVSIPVVSSVAGLSGTVSGPELAAKLSAFIGGTPGGGTPGIPAGGWKFTDLSSDVQTLLGYAQDAVRIGGDLTGTPASPQVRGGSVGLAELATALALPKAQLSSDVQASLARADTALQSGDVGGPGGDVPPATSTVLGTIKLTGDLGGTANSPTVPGLATKVETDDTRLTNARTPLDHDHAGEDIASGTISAARLGSGAATGKVLQATSATAAQWVTPAGGGAGSGLLATLHLSGPGPHVFDDDTWHDHVIEVDSPTPAVVQLPTGQSPGAFAVIEQYGAGQVTIQKGTGALLDVPGGGATAATRTQFAHVTVRRRDDPSGVAFPTSGLLARFQGASLGSAGSAIASWADSSGVGSQALLQPTATNQPVVATVSGFKAARFDGANDFLNMTGALLDVARNRSVLVFYALCVYPTAVAGKKTLWSLSVGGGTAGRAFLQKEADASLVVGGRRLDADAANNVARGGTIPTGAPFLIVGRMSFAANSAGVYLNGAAPAATTGFTNPNTAFLTGSTANTSNTASTSGAVGANSTGAAEYWQGDILDMGVYASDVNRAQLDTALMNQYPGLFTASDYLGAQNRWAAYGELAS